MEEVKERQAELSKMRALMFYHERKQHHMNKIKSKVCTLLTFSDQLNGRKSLFTVTNCCIALFFLHKSGR